MIVDTNIKVVAGTFSSPDRLEDAVDELQLTGFDRADLSVPNLVSKAHDRSARGPRRISGIVVGPRPRRTHYVGRHSMTEAQAAIVGASLGVPALAATTVLGLSGADVGPMIVGAFLWGGVGALCGAAVAWWIGMRRARRLADEIAYGGLSLWVGVRDRARAEQALEILRRHGARDVRPTATRARCLRPRVSA